MPGDSAKSDEMWKRTKQFALRIIRLFRALPRSPESQVLGRQLLRSGTSVGANYRAACRGRSKAEFIAKIGIVLEETDETAYWLELLNESGIMPRSQLALLQTEADELSRIFLATQRTARGDK